MPPRCQESSFTFEHAILPPSFLILIVNDENFHPLNPINLPSPAQRCGEPTEAPTSNENARSVTFVYDPALSARGLALAHCWFGRIDIMNRTSFSLCEACKTTSSGPAQSAWQLLPLA